MLHWTVIVCSCDFLVGYQQRMLLHVRYLAEVWCHNSTVRRQSYIITIESHTGFKNEK